MSTFYQDYLKSDAWKLKAEDAKLRAGNRCQVCYSADRLEVHHRTYTRLGNEEPMDLTVLCHPCHALFHGKMDAGRAITGKELSENLARHRAERHIRESINALTTNATEENTEAEPCN